MAKLKMVKELDFQRDVIWRIYLDDKEIDHSWKEQDANSRFNNLVKKFSQPLPEPVIVKEVDV
jgi:hypothetical protein